MKIFIVGVTLAAIVLCSFSIYQFFTGYSHSPLSAYRPDRQMISGFYRATGFFEHPVPFSGFCLAWFTYFWSLFCYGQTAAKSVFSNLILLIVVLFILMIFLSGSRMPAAIAMSLLIVIPWSITKIRGQKLFVAILAILFIGLLFTWLTGLGSRFLEIASDTEGFGLGERLQFWRVHWSIFWDSPLLGHGHSWLDRYYRSEFYLRLGLGGMEHKYPAHNVFLEVLAQTGFVGFIIIFGGTFLAGVNLKKVFTSANNGVYFWSIRNMFLALGAYGLVQNTFMDTPVAFAVIGLTLISYFVAVLDA